MAASFYEKPTKIKERLNSSGSDDFGGIFPLEADRQSQLGRGDQKVSFRMAR